MQDLSSLKVTGASLGVQWIGICLPMQGHGLDSWSGKIPQAKEQVSHALQLLKPVSPRTWAWEPALCTERGPTVRRPCCGGEPLPLITARERTHTARETQFSSVAQSCLTLCDPMACGTPGLPVHHQLPELAQTHVHRVGDAIQPSHPLLPPSPPAFNLSQCQGLFQWVISSHRMAKVLEFQLLDLLAVQGTLKSLLQRPSATKINKQTKRLPSNAGRVGLISGPGTKIPHMPHFILPIILWSHYYFNYPHLTQRCQAVTLEEERKKKRKVRGTEEKRKEEEKEQREGEGKEGGKEGQSSQLSSKIEGKMTMEDLMQKKFPWRSGIMWMQTDFLP